MSDNSASTPQPIVVNADEERAKFERLPKVIRLALIESVYEYNTDQVLDVMRQVREHLSFGLFPITEDRVIKETIKQIGLNDLHISSKEMDKKWSMELKLPITGSQSKPQHWPTRPTARIAKVSGITRKSLGLKPPPTSARRSSMVFDLFGPAIPHRRKPTRTG